MLSFSLMHIFVEIKSFEGLFTQEKHREGKGILLV